MSATKQVGPWTDAEVQREKRNGVPCVVLTVASYEKQRAVASEMLTALRAVAGVYEGYQDPPNYARKALAAIAKAEGR